ncbi:hypothetical protein ACFVH6_21630 [Spirillospora sp. NPDC127200]
MTDNGATPTPIDDSSADPMLRKAYADLQHLVEDLTGYRPWHSDGGRPYATRRPLTKAEAKAGVRQTLDADDVAGLTKAIRAHLGRSQRAGDSGSQLAS